MGEGNTAKEVFASPDFFALKLTVPYGQSLVWMGRLLRCLHNRTEFNFVLAGAAVLPCL